MRSPGSTRKVVGGGGGICSTGAHDVDRILIHITITIVLNVGYNTSVCVFFLTIRSITCDSVRTC